MLPDPRWRWCAIQDGVYYILWEDYFLLFYFTIVCAYSHLTS
jgi:hypothetical protein